MVNIAIGGVVIYRIIYQLKQEIIDLLKLLISSVLLFTLLWWTTFIIFKMAYRDVFKNLSFRVLDHSLDGILLFYALIQLHWYLLFHHIELYDKLGSGQPYSKLCMLAKAKERKMIWALSVVYFTYFLLVLFIDIMPSFEYFEDVDTLFMNVASVLILVI